jgi:SNF2 family DNA or RNA helicase
VGPLLALKTYANELTKHFGPGAACPLIVVFIRSPKEMRAWTRQNLIGACDVVVTTYSVVRACFERDGVQHVPFNVAWERLICDEAHLCSNPTTWVNKAMRAIQAKSKWFVSGTIVQNALSDLKDALEFIGFDFSSSSSSSLPDPGSQAFQDLMSNVFLRRTPEDLTDVVIPHIRPEDVKTLEIDFYDDTERELYDHWFLSMQKRLRESKNNHLQQQQQHQQQQHKQRVKKPHSHSPFSLSNHELVMITRLRQECVSWPIIDELDKTQDLRLPRNMIIPPSLDSIESWSSLMDMYMRTALCIPSPVPLLTRSLGDHVLPPVTSKERTVLHYLFNMVVPRGDKLIVFSEWKEPLARIATLLRIRAFHMGIDNPTDEDAGFGMIIGKVDITKRDEIIKQMHSNPKLKCLLITLGSGSTSLDLTFANHVIAMTVWYNPVVTEHAFDRIGGLAQTKPIFAYRIIIKGTIEEEILRISQYKQTIAHQVYDIARNASPLDYNMPNDEQDNFNDDNLAEEEERATFIREINLNQASLLLPFSEEDAMSISDSEESNKGATFRPSDLLIEWIMRR